MIEDSVDRIAAAWRAVLPEMPVESLGVFMRILHIARFYERTMERVGRRHGLRLGDVYVMLALRRSPGPLTVNQLRDELFVTAGAVSKQIDRLEAKGLVSRRAVPSDKRSVTTRLTRAGYRLVDDELLSTGDYVFRAPLDLTPEGCKRLTSELRRLVNLLERNAAQALKRG